MTLDNEFKELTEKLIVDTLEVYKNQERQMDQNIKKVWKVDNMGDFSCGYFVGEIVGSALTAFQHHHKREPSEEEHIEIFALLEKHSEDISTFFMNYNSN
ncbi:MAG: hypothetical protein HOD60_01460 [Candidatus Nitrosopelagicus sp.]|nr:hypothetical protein [Candidatus Nitrosopelagicus sp.]